MLTKENIEDGILLIFNPIDEIKNNVFGISIILSLICTFLYFYLNLPMKSVIIGFCCIVALILIIQCLLYYTIEIYLQREKIQIIERHWIRKKEPLYFYYRDIKNIERIHVGGRASFNFLKINTFLEEEYDILKYTSLEKELDEIIQAYEEVKEQVSFYERLKEWEKIYLGEIERRYAMVLQEMLKEEKVFLIQRENHFTVNAGEEAIQHLGMFQSRKFEEMDFYKFYLDYLSNKEYENIRVRVADNGRDCKEVSMKQLKEDINKLRDEK